MCRCKDAGKRGLSRAHSKRTCLRLQLTFMALPSPTRSFMFSLLVVRNRKFKPSRVSIENEKQPDDQERRQDQKTKKDRSNKLPDGTSVLRPLADSVSWNSNLHDWMCLSLLLFQKIDQSCGLVSHTLMLCHFRSSPAWVRPSWTWSSVLSSLKRYCQASSNSSWTGFYYVIVYCCYYCTML